MSAKLLDSANAFKIRQAVADRNAAALRAVSFDSISIGGCIELCCAYRDWLGSANECGLEIFERLALAMSVVKNTSGRLTACLHSPAQWRFPPCDGNVDLFAVAQKKAFQERTWNEFQQGLVRQLKANGFQADFATALSAAFGEIAENIPDHSAEGTAEMAPALIGYFLVPGEVHFAVGDLGRGVLSSLRENPRWAGLRNSREAILATLNQAATRRPEHAEGTGLKLALKCFVDRNGILSLRSGDATAHVDRDQQGHRTVSGLAPALGGTCVVACCFARGIPTERGVPEK